MKNLKQEILAATNGGLNFFEFVIGNLVMVDENHCKKVLNPFYDDTNPGLSIFKIEGRDRWSYKDHGDDTFTGDVFDFASHYYKLDPQKDFVAILKKITKDLELNLETDYKQMEFVKEDWMTYSGYELHYWDADHGVCRALSYFERYGITESVLKRYKVHAIRSYKTYNNGIIFNKLRDFELVIAYDDLKFAKIYSPNPKKFFYIGTRDRNHVFGLRQIYSKSIKEKIGTLIITGGEKDVLTLASIGYNAICLNSETAKLPQDLKEHGLYLAERIVIMYDNDDTGIKKSRELMKEISDLGFNVTVVYLSEIMSKEHGKDISDYMLNKLPLEVLQDLVDDAVNHIDIKSLEPNNNYIEDIEYIGVNITDVFNISVDKTIERPTPYFKDEIFINLPPLMRDTAELFENKRERDMFLLSFFTVLSGSVPSVSGWYRDQLVYPNIFGLIAAPSAAGKSVMGKAVSLFTDINPNDLVKSFSVISPSSTFKQLVKKLANNKNASVLFDPEVEALGEMHRYDAHGINYILKNGYDNVNIADARTDRSNIVYRPSFSFLIGGDTKQINKLIPSTNDGLFSRFLIYNFVETIPFSIVRPDMWMHFAEQKEGYTQSLVGFINYTSQHPFSFMLTDEQFTNITKMGLELQGYYSSKASFNMDHVVKRGGLAIFKIALLLSSYRKYHEKNKDAKYTCNDADYNIAISMVETLLEHSFAAGLILQRELGLNTVPKSDDRKFKILKAVPDCFNRQQALQAAKDLQIKISDRTIDGYLSELQAKGVLEHTHDNYCKKTA